MRRFLLDTGIASDFINHRHGIFEPAQHEVTRGNPVGIGISVLAELVYGVEQSVSRDRNMQRLRKALPSWKVWPFDTGRPSSTAGSPPSCGGSAGLCNRSTSRSPPSHSP